jgi:2-keto-4-pentenoate hydratase/2-oxohepta-3-ene-1,7-dioic acid hydratase in catechol pathway
VSGPLFVAYDEGRVGAVLDDGGVRDICSIRHLGAGTGIEHVRSCLPAAIAEWEALSGAVEAGTAVDAPRLLAPIPLPINVFGAPVNYLEHQGELGALRAPSEGTTKDLGLFVKAVGSISGPSDPIELPRMEREFHYEGEIAIVIGRGGEDLDDAGALAAIAGFTGALDITMRLEADAREERSMRKSYRTFTPVGPAVLPFRPEQLDTLSLSLRLNGEQRQAGRLDELVVGVLGLVKLASSIVRLESGDLILTGTPAGVGRIVPGDRVELTVDGIPPLDLEVTQRGERR